MRFAKPSGARAELAAAGAGGPVGIDFPVRMSQTRAIAARTVRGCSTSEIQHMAHKHCSECGKKFETEATGAWRGYWRERELARDGSTKRRQARALTCSDSCEHERRMRFQKRRRALAKAKPAKAKAKATKQRVRK